MFLDECAADKHAVEHAAATILALTAKTIGPNQRREASGCLSGNVLRRQQHERSGGGGYDPAAAHHTLSLVNCDTLRLLINYELRLKNSDR